MPPTRTMYESVASHASSASTSITTRTMVCAGSPVNVRDSTPAPPKRAGPPNTSPNDPHALVDAPVQPSAPLSKDDTAKGDTIIGHGDDDGVGVGVVVSVGVIVGVDDGVGVGVGRVERLECGSRSPSVPVHRPGDFSCLVRSRS